jgi:hypothetical protein
MMIQKEWIEAAFQIVSYLVANCPAFQDYTLVDLLVNATDIDSHHI